MLYRSVACLYVAASLGLRSHALAAEPRAGTVTLDPARTIIQFSLPGALHDTHGTFKLTQGTIAADPTTSTANGSVVIDATSGDSQMPSRDANMNREVLESSKYPTIVFTARHVTGSLGEDGNFSAHLDGTLLIHGMEHPQGIDLQGKLVGNELTAHTHFVIPYVAWGMKDPGILFLSVAKQVDLDVTAVGHVAWDAPAHSSAH